MARPHDVSYNYLTIPVSEENSRKLNQIAARDGKSTTKVLMQILEKGLAQAGEPRVSKASR